MSDHEFEKQVQRKLDELKLRPSNAVWTAIEHDIRSQKKRRRFGFWMPLTVVGLAVTGYFIYPHSQPKADVLAQSKTINVHSNNSHSEKISTQKDAAVLQAPGVADAQDPAVSESFRGQTASETDAIQNGNKVVSTDNKRIAVNESPQSTNIISNKPSSNKKSVIKRKAVVHRFNDKELLSTTNFSTNNTIPDETVTQSYQTPSSNHIARKISEQEDLASSLPRLVPNSTETIATEKAYKAPLFNTMPLPEVASAKAPLQRQRAPKWEYGVMGTAGISRLTQSNLFQVQGWLGSGPKSQEKNTAEDLAQKSASMYNDPRGASNSNNPLINTAPPPVKKAAPIKQDFAWSAGVFAQRPLSRRLRLTVGFQYAYMSMHTTIGKLVEQPIVVNQAASAAPVVNRYYTSFDALQQGNGLAYNSQFQMGMVPRDSLTGSEYTYRFHSIELPVAINWQINKGRRLPPFVLDAGISIGKLLTTDALHYDGRKDIYYKDNSLFSKTQVNALMGLNVGLFQQSKLPVWIGPHLRYSLTGLLKKEVSNGQYIWSTGVQARILLSRL